MTNESFEPIRIATSTAKRQAKKTRTKWKGAGPSAERDLEFDAEVKNLDAAIQALRPFADENSAYRKEAQREIGDCHGVMGGVYRDWGKYGEAADSYDLGLPYEQSFLELGGQPNSYCLVQRLVSRVLLAPQAFRQGQPIKGLNVKAELEASADEIARQLKGPRQGDPWAQADFALVHQLLGRESAEAEWDNFDDLRPGSSVYESTFDVVHLLRQRLVLDVDETARWEDLESRLASGGST
jgi:hypothetical protein